MRAVLEVPHVRDEDLEFATGCAAAHPDRRGGQHAGICVGVLVIHKPTGIAVRVTSERSQYRCREIAVAKLQSLLDAVEYEEESRHL